MDDNSIKQPSLPTGFTEKINEKNKLVGQKDELVSIIHDAENKLKLLTGRYNSVHSRIKGVDRKYTSKSDVNNPTLKKLKFAEASLSSEIKALSGKIKQNQDTFNSLDTEIQELTNSMLEEIEKYDKQMNTMEKVDIQSEVLNQPEDTSPPVPISSRAVVDKTGEPSQLPSPVEVNIEAELDRIKDIEKGLDHPEVMAFVEKYIDTPHADKVTDLADYLTLIGKPKDTLKIAEMFIETDNASQSVNLAKILDSNSFFELSLNVSHSLEIAGKDELAKHVLKTIHAKFLKSPEIAITNLFLDKVKGSHLIPKEGSEFTEKTIERHEGWVDAFADLTLAKGVSTLKKSDEFKQLNINTQELVGAMGDLLVGSSKLYFECENAIESRQVEPFSQSLVDKVKGMGIQTNNNSLLIPFGKKGHATKLLVSKQNDGNYQVTFFNTGQGIDEKHGKIQEGGKLRYLTALKHIDVPASTVENTYNWTRLIRCSKENDPSVLYEALSDLTDGGRIPEDIPNDLYELPQEHGTCTVQSSLAFIRSTMLSQNTPMEENFADYKQLKALLDQSLWKNMKSTPDAEAELEKTDQGIKDYALSKIERSSRHLMIAKIAKNDDLFVSALSQYGPTVGLTVEDAQNYIDEHGQFKLIQYLVKAVAADWASKGVADTTRIDTELAKPVLAIFNTRRKEADVLVKHLENFLDKGAEAYKGKELTNNFIRTLNNLYALGFTSDVVAIALNAFESEHIDQDNEYIQAYKSMILE